MGGLPQSRAVANDQSRVTISALAPASLARRTRARLRSRSPIQNSWKNVFGLAATTSSTATLANELSPIAVPASAAPRATATSPSGCTACTPVGDAITGSEMSCPSTEVAMAAGGGPVRDARRGQPQLAEGGHVVAQGGPLLAAGLQGEENGAGQPPPRSPAGFGDGLEPLIGAGHRASFGALDYGTV